MVQHPDLTDGLPDGLVARPLTLDDARAVTDVMAAEELAVLGEVVIEYADIVSDWQRPSFDITASTIGVFTGDDLVAYAERTGHTRGDAAVHPDHQGRGIGTWLAGWLQETARAAGDDVIGMPKPEGSPGDRLLESLGFRVRWNSWVLQLPEGAAIPSRPLPPGYAVRTARPDEHEAVWTVVEDAFLEWSVRPRQTFDDFAASVFRRPGFEPWSASPPTPRAAWSGCRSWCWPRAAPTSTSSPYAATSGRGAWPPRCWPTRSRSPATTAPRARS